MTDTQAQYQSAFLDSIHDISAAQWNALSGTDYPFLRHEFLAVMEDSGCTTTITGWQPHHLIIREEGKSGKALALLPLYLKTDSFGEYVFDWSWADAYHRHGLEYYPKLLSAIPYTPATGPRFCVKPHLDRNAVLAFMVDAIKAEAQRLNASGWHLLFPQEEDSRVLETLGIRQRAGCQYHWFNHGYGDFDQLLASFSSRKRKNIRKERQRVSDAGIHFQVLEGADISLDQWRQFYLFYQSTYLVRGRNPYLNEDFFLGLSRLMPQQLVMVLAYREDACIAGALSFRSSDTLYGRYWGCSEEYQFLHFETCYYQGIDYCLQHGLKRFDSGAQGEHKIQRGFEPVSTWSNHWLAHEGFHAAIDQFLREESQHVERYIRHAGEYLPFRQQD